MNTQKIHGAVYTPAWIVHKILDEVGFHGKGKIIDPACGDGAFLSAAVERILQAKGTTEQKRQRLTDNIYGLDIDAEAIAACKKRLSRLAAAADIKNIRWKIFCQDALDAATTKEWQGTFDFVVGNPPYVRIQNLGTARRNMLQKNWAFCQSGSTDIYIAFFELGLDLLKKDATLGFITPNTWLKTHTAKAMRRYFQRAKVVKTLIDFEHHQLFDNITTYCLITVLQKNGRNDKFSLVKGNDKGDFKCLGSLPIDKMDDSNWILCPPAGQKKLHKMRQNGTPLGELTDIHVGITTLADNCYIFHKPQPDGEAVLIPHPLNGKQMPVEKGILRPIVKASTLKTASDDQQRFILFPYQKINGKHRLINEEELRETYPLAYAYLKSVKKVLDSRDRGKPNPVGWYAFGRSQGLDTSFGKKILTSPMNLRPHFIVWEKPDYTFYSGYCIKYKGDLRWLAQQLNSEEMAFYINTVSRDYQNNYKSYAKSFLNGFPLPSLELGLDYGW